MEECRIVSESFCVDSFGRELHNVAAPFYATSVRFRCATHNMPIIGPTSFGDRCPLGKIEAATEEALARIIAASNPSSPPQG